jgi:hypothetical protein
VVALADNYRAALRPSAELDRPYLYVSAAGGYEATAKELVTGYGLGYGASAPRRHHRSSHHPRDINQAA